MSIYSLRAVASSHYVLLSAVAECVELQRHSEHVSLVSVKTSKSSQQTGALVLSPFVENEICMDENYEKAVTRGRVDHFGNIFADRGNGLERNLFGWLLLVHKLDLLFSHDLPAKQSLSSCFRPVTLPHDLDLELDLNSVKRTKC